MGACASMEEEEKQQQKQAAVERTRSLGITAQFLRNWATLEEVNNVYKMFIWKKNRDGCRMKRETRG